MSLIACRAQNEDQALAKRLVPRDLVMYGERPQHRKACAFDEFFLALAPLCDFAPRV
jgi:hypothetical protein